MKASMKARRRGMKEFVVEVSGSGIIYLKAMDEDDAIEKAKKWPCRKMWEAIDLIEIQEIQEVDGHG